MTKPGDKIIIKNETGHSIDFDHHDLDAWNKGGETTIIARCNHKWISVKDRLPEFGQWVLVYIPDKILEKHYRPKPIYFIKIRYTFKSIDCKNPKSRFYKVTHWMPLPEPPEDNNA